MKKTQPAPPFAMYAIEYSPTDNVFHVRGLKRAAKENAAALAKGDMTPRILIGTARTLVDAMELAQAFEIRFDS